MQESLNYSMFLMQETLNYSMLLNAGNFKLFNVLMQESLNYSMLLMQESKLFNVFNAGIIKLFNVFNTGIYLKYIGSWININDFNYAYLFMFIEVGQVSRRL